MGIPEYQVPLLWALVSAGRHAVLDAAFRAFRSSGAGTPDLVRLGSCMASSTSLLGLNGGVPWLVWPLFAFYGLFLAATEGAEKALVADLAPRDRLGTAYGWFNLTAGLMLLPASLLFGWLWQDISPLTAFGFLRYLRIACGAVP